VTQVEYTDAIQFYVGTRDTTAEFHARAVAKALRKMCVHWTFEGSCEAVGHGFGCLIPAANGSGFWHRGVMQDNNKATVAAGNGNVTEMRAIDARPLYEEPVSLAAVAAGGGGAWEDATPQCPWFPGAVSRFRKFGHELVVQADGSLVIVEETHVATARSSSSADGLGAEGCVWARAFRAGVVCIRSNPTTRVAVLASAHTMNGCDETMQAEVTWSRLQELGCLATHPMAFEYEALMHSGLGGCPDPMLFMADVPANGLVEVARSSVTTQMAGRRSRDRAAAEAHTLTTVLTLTALGGARCVPALG